jgi:moderate conductance mechanosensitive channel
VLTALLVPVATTPPTPPATTPTSGVEDDASFASDVWTWLSGAPLRIVLILVVALIARALAHRIIDGVVRAMTSERSLHERPGAGRRLSPSGITSRQLLTDRRLQRAETIGSLLRSIASVTIFGLGFVLVLGELGINLGPIVATAGIAGVALGFGAQAVVKDFLSGVFMILEDQYGVGDVIDTGLAVGTVEEVALRTTKIRDSAGVVWYVRNGEIVRIGNRSQGWSLAILDVPIAYDENLETVRGLVAEVGQQMLEDSDLQDRLLEAPVVVGVESVSGDVVTVRVTARTAPQESGTVTRELRERLKTAFDEAGVRVPIVARPYTPGGPGHPAGGNPT